jgi:c-di-GMP-binding flagellar brake protein YcgR
MYQITGLNVNQLVELEILTGEMQGVYRSRVENITKNCIVLGAPLDKGTPIPLRAGTLVRVNYHDEKATYSFETEVSDRDMGVGPTISTARPLSIKRTQRRNFVRLDSNLSLVFNIISDELDEAGKPLKGLTLDISGGGTRFESNLSLPEGIVLEMNINLPRIGTVSALGKVVRTTATKNSVKKHYIIGVQFMIIEEKERDKIIRYIFDKQRELRQRGLL